MNTEKTIVEINGIKMEVDMRTAKIVHENLRIGSKVKLLVKSTYGEPKVCSGIIAAFDASPTMPSITVAYIESSYANAELKFAVVNEKSAAQYEMVPSQDDELPISKETLLKAFDSAEQKAVAALEDVRARRDYFQRTVAAE